MNSPSRNQTASTHNTSSTGGHRQSPSTSSTLSTWAGSTDTTERFYVNGTNTGRGYFHQAGKMADWEIQFNQARNRG
ncbi:hypothetical protein BGZ61DRAFT_531008 [Ilyonectria robusta]|uniref:uncharacterized protein n=1 Tax=Ilyonectria robusta TaxID=1079257 RepID=UPI001E8C9F7F|nr:uncharacterized protein BGZ61DRAFT_531008 [Ilyonectria robusta]KAH8714381.1 hypothetical protein BGZ61DRAFT_531008 [Ilyonectria robusta]